MGKVATTWRLMKDSWGVLMRDKELMLFPIASGAATLLVLATFILPFIGATASSLAFSDNRITFTASSCPPCPTSIAPSRYLAWCSTSGS